MPVEIGLEMYAEKPPTLPPFTGHVARGLLLHVFREVDPTLSGLLHELDASKPYSVTPLRFRKLRRTPEGLVLDPSHPCRVGFRLLKDDLARHVIDFVQKRSTVMVRDAQFCIAHLTLRSATYRELLEEARPTSRITILYRTPTYLASLGSGYHWMFPDPVRVFSHLMRGWNRFTDHRPFTKEEYTGYRDWLGRSLGVAAYRLQTRMAVMRAKKAAGFVGWVAYELKDLESPWSSVTVALARYAEFANVGGNRTGGFGVVKLLERETTSDRGRLDG